MKQKHILILATIIIITLIIVVIFKSIFFREGESSDTTRQNTQTENYIQCKADNYDVILTSSPLVTEFPSSNVAVVAASNLTGENISITIPLKKIGTFQNKIGTNENEQPKLHYTTNKQISYENNYINEATDISKVIVTRYDTVVEGSFSGKLTRINPDGWKIDEKITLTKCTFSIKEFTKLF